MANDFSDHEAVVHNGRLGVASMSGFGVYVRLSDGRRFKIAPHPANNTPGLTEFFRRAQVLADTGEPQEGLMEMS